MFRDWIRASLQRRLLLALILGVGVSLATFQVVVDRLVDGYIERSFSGTEAERTRRDQLLEEVDIVLFGGVAIVLGVCGLTAILAVRGGLRPLERVAHAAEGVSVERPARALPLAGVPLEIRPLCERFNQLLERVGDALENERRFVAGLAHELRTPLAEIRALGEAGQAAQANAAPGEGTELRVFLRQTTAAAIAMQDTIESLLAVARADRIAVEQALEPIELGATLERRIERLRITEPQRCAVLACRVPAGVWIQTDPRLFDAVIVNLLANALQHGMPGEPVEIDWHPAPDGRAGALSIRNRAPGLTAADLPRLLERRAATAVDEVPGRAGSGAGLGLWIVRRLCGVLGLRLALRFDDPQQLTVRLEGFVPL